MHADRRLFDSSSMTPPPAPEIDAWTCTVDDVIERRKAIIKQAQMSRLDTMLDIDVPTPTMGDALAYTLLTEHRYRVW
ncbi:hypothetical protein [Bradyrhizobium sp. Bra64]|uniref:hypothetical protein n=1 Tax=Bradyrhizobium sp. Bra64 TaxID=2926009 RepID=UPI0021183D54|nr:hypothetical protein [Bradyrhizobium sp. Bra64]